MTRSTSWLRIPSSGVPVLLLAFVLVACLEQGCSGDNDNREPTPGLWVDTSGDRQLLIVTTEALHEVAQEYATYRQGQGYLVTVVTTEQALEDAGGGASLADAVQSWTLDWADTALQDAADPAALQLYLLLIGDALEGSADDPTYIPVVPGEGDFVGDFAYGDLDGDGAPEVAIGRLPMRFPEEVRAYLERVQEYENQRSPGPWNKRLSACAGEGGFGPDIDYLLEYAATRIFESLSYDIDITMTYAAASSPYYLPPSLWDDDYVERYNAGAVLQPYIGHTLGWSNTAALETPARRGFVAYLACSNGTFQSSSTPGGLADEMLMHPAGPMNSLAATDWSHPYGNAVLALELSVAIINDRAPTYGLALAWAKQQMLYSDSLLRAELDVAADAFLDEPAEHLIRTHIVMYNLLGDPAIDPGFPLGRVTFDGPEEATPGATITVIGSATADRDGNPMPEGEVTVTLEVERAEIPGDLIPVDGQPTTEQALANHATANNKIITSATGTVTNGRFEVQLTIPYAGVATGRHYLKGFALSSTSDAMGSAPITIRR